MVKDLAAYGPAYVGNAGTIGVTRPEATYAWCSEIVLASTWNTAILERPWSESV